MAAVRRLLERAVARAASLATRLRRVERREASEFRRWVQNTNNLVHLSVLLFVPLVIAVVTYISNNVTTLTFLLFPPLASGTYTLFSDPEGQYSHPVKFVASLTVGSLCGLAAFEFTKAVYGGPGAALVHPESAALAVLLTGGVTWAVDVESPSAFSTALLTLVSGEVDPTAYVASVFLSSSIVAAVFFLWREEFYEERAQYLYETVRGDDHVLVPMRGDTAERTALFGARLAAAHDAGKVVLLDVVPAESGVDSPPADVATATVGDDDDGVTAELERAQEEAAPAIERLEACASQLRTRVGVPCEVVVAAGDPLPTTLQVAENANCDLVVTPYEEEQGLLSEFVRGIFAGPPDAVAFRSTGESRHWRRILVLVARPGDTAHAMIDFAERLAESNGVVSVTTCIGREVERRRAESRLANLAETAEGPIETRVSRTDVSSFIAANAGDYDLLVLGSSRDRSAASRFVSPPTFERLHEVDCDVAVFDRGDL
jgi:nucleotide-binding universal stress UspA family protein